MHEDSNDGDEHAGTAEVEQQDAEGEEDRKDSNGSVETFNESQKKRCLLHAARAEPPGA